MINRFPKQYWIVGEHSNVQRVIGKWLVFSRNSAILKHEIKSCNLQRVCI